MSDTFPCIHSANSLFRSGRYREALHMYECVASANPSLARSIAYNIDLCQRRTTTQLSRSPISSSKIDSTKEGIADYLSRPIALTGYSHVPENKYILSLFDSTRRVNIELDHLKAAIVCADTSPFQRDLLWYVATLCRRLEFPLRDSVSPADAGLSLGKLVRIASNKTDWLLERELVRRFYIKFSICDRRAWDLVENPPDECTVDHRCLPKLRPPQPAGYQWDAPPETVKEVPKTDPFAKLTMGTILLNETKFIGLNLLQHYEMCTSWVLVEGACKGYPPRKVSNEGLSLDNCAIQIRLFPDPAGKLVYLQHGWTRATGEDAKSELRNRYIRGCNTDLLLVVDADEFYLKEHLEAAIHKFDESSISAVTMPQVHLWKSTQQFITGEYYDISHTRLYRTVRGMTYRQNHNFPEASGKFIHNTGQFKYSRTISQQENGRYGVLEPCCFHMGFAKDYDDMRDKSDYYINRGEAQTRQSTTRSRAAWFDDQLPEKCLVRPWGGQMPAVLNHIAKAM